MLNLINYISNPVAEDTRIINYFTTDDIEKFPELQNKNWNIDFKYRFNSLGFRSNEIVHGKDSLVTFGCSHTLGVGVPENYRWSDLISKELDLLFRM